MMSILFEFIEQNLEAFSVILSFCAWVAGLITKKGWERIKRRYIMRELKLKEDKDWNINMRVYGDVQLTHYSQKHEVNATSDVLAAMNMYKFLQVNGLLDKQKCYINKPQVDSIGETDNMFCIGGFIANEQTEYYFKRFFPSFRVYTNRSGENYAMKKDKYIFSETKRGFRWGENEDEEYTVKKGERYAILIRLTEEDFNIGNTGVVYILYGNDDISTLGLSEYILNHSDDLAEKTKKRKHFFIAFSVQEVNKEPKLNMSDFKDLTDVMFSN